MNNSPTSSWLLLGGAEGGSEESEVKKQYERILSLKKK